MRIRPFPCCKLCGTDLAVAILVRPVEIDDALILPLGILFKEVTVFVAHPFVTHEGHAGFEVCRHLVFIGVDHVPDAVNIIRLEARYLTDAAIKIILDDLTIFILVAKPEVPIKIAPLTLKFALRG